jgi:hypothetical protein
MSIERVMLRKTDRIVATSYEKGYLGTFAAQPEVYGAPQTLFLPRSPSLTASTGLHLNARTRLSFVDIHSRATL